MVAQMGLSRATVAKWWNCWQGDGEAGLVDRSSRPHRSPRRTGAEVEARVCRLRRSKRWGPARLAVRTGVPASTVHMILVRCGLNRLSWIDRPCGRTIRRYERPEPGDLVHLDVKKVAKVPPGGGWRAHGRGHARSRGTKRRPRVGYSYLHVATNDHSRLAYVEALDNETADTVVGFFDRARLWFQSIGNVVQSHRSWRILSFLAKRLKKMANALLPVCVQCLAVRQRACRMQVRVMPPPPECRCRWPVLLKGGVEPGKSLVVGHDPHKPGGGGRGNVLRAVVYEPDSRRTARRLDHCVVEGRVWLPQADGRRADHLVDVLPPLVGALPQGDPFVEMVCRQRDSGSGPVKGGKQGDTGFDGSELAQQDFLDCARGDPRVLEETGVDLDGGHDVAQVCGNAAVGMPKTSPGVKSSRKVLVADHSPTP